MYLKKVKIENIGPISKLDYSMPFDGDRPLPVIFAGKNGSGKSLVLAHIVSAMIEAHNYTFENGEKEENHKRQDHLYVRDFLRGIFYSITSLEFSDDFYYKELTNLFPLERIKKEYPTEINYADWGHLLDNSHGGIVENFCDSSKRRSLKKLLNGPFIYFSPNRFENPAWSNKYARLDKQDIELSKLIELNRIYNKSNKPVVNCSNTQKNRLWTSKIVDSFDVIEKRMGEEIIHVERLIGDFITSLFELKPPVNWTVNKKGAEYPLSIQDVNKKLLGEAFFSSTGEMAILNFVLTILRHADLASEKSGVEIKSLSEIKGMVVIDEIDLHLHTGLQRTLLPQMIGMFPNIQFIMTTHSPLFLLGMRDAFGDKGFEIIDLPKGEKIDVERFEEFGEAYNAFEKTKRFEDEKKIIIRDATKPLCFVEGDWDKYYIEMAAKLLGKEEILNKFSIHGGEGKTGLDKIWKKFKHELWGSVLQKVILFYDCDVAERNSSIGLAYQKRLDTKPHKIKKGMENLFPDATIERARQSMGWASDSWELDSNKKSDLYNWLCVDENGTADDFQYFSQIFDILQEIDDKK